MIVIVIVLFHIHFPFADFYTRSFYKQKEPFPPGLGDFPVGRVFVGGICWTVPHHGQQASYA